MMPTIRSDAPFALNALFRQGNHSPREIRKAHPEARMGFCNLKTKPKKHQRATFTMCTLPSASSIRRMETPLGCVAHCRPSKSK